MKIIDNTQDFYEFESYTYGTPDQSIIWKRSSSSLDLNKIDKFDKSKIIKILNNMIYNPNTLNGYSTYFWSFVYYDMFEQYLIGIYPYVYLCIDYTEYYKKWNNHILFNVSEDEFKDPEYMHLLLTEEYNRDTKIIPAYIQNAKKKGIKYLYINETKYKTDDSWIKENREIFKLVDSPVFMAELNMNNNKFNITTDINIIKDTDFFKHYNREDIDANVYTNIEQFIVERNMKPIPDADNNTKIVAAGFDLKTSFRNM